MKIELDSENLQEIISSELLTEKLADRIIQAKTNIVWDEFDRALLEAIRTSTKRIVDEVMTEYLEESAVKSSVVRVLNNMTKQEIFKALVGGGGCNKK